MEVDFNGFRLNLQRAFNNVAANIEFEALSPQEIEDWQELRFLIGASFSFYDESDPLMKDIGDQEDLFEIPETE